MTAAKSVAAVAAQAAKASSRTFNLSIKVVPAVSGVLSEGGPHSQLSLRFAKSSGRSERVRALFETLSGQRCQHQFSCLPSSSAGTLFKRLVGGLRGARGSARV